MSRLGEGTLSFGTYSVGTIWVQHVSADRAFYPRLALSVGCQLKEVPPDQELGNPGITDYRIATLDGQLRWKAEHGHVLGRVYVPAGLEGLKSAAYAPEHQFMMYCDLTPAILKRLEAERNGAPVEIWMDLSGTWVSQGTVQMIYQRPWRFVVPQDMWIAFLAASGHSDFELIEVRHIARGGGDLTPAIEHLHAARRLVSAGERERAVGMCRMVLEAADAAVRKTGSGKGLSDYLSAATEPGRAKHYTKIVSAIKQLASMDHHDFGHGTPCSHAEALAIISLCETLLVLIGDTLPRAST